MMRFQANDKQKRPRPERRVSIAYNGRTRLVFTFMIVALALLVLSVCLAVRVFRSKVDATKRVFANQLGTNTDIPFRRGSITDRYGTVLAESMQMYRVIIEPRNILLNDGFNREATVDALVSVLGCEQEKLDNMIDEKPDSYYVRVGRDISEEDRLRFESYAADFNAEAAKVEKDTKRKQPKIIGVNFEMFYRRHYPYESFASDVIGFSHGDEAIGNNGIEQYYNSYLSGEMGRRLTYITEDGIAERDYVAPENGCTVVTTIDHIIQSAAEESIEEFFKTYNADNVGVIAVDPDNGEILAMATDRPFDLNNPGQLSRVSDASSASRDEDESNDALLARIHRNFAVETAYEPGSTAKCVTVSAAFEEATEDSSSYFYCDGGESFGTGSDETYVRCSGGPHHEVSLARSLVVSCNDAMMHIGHKLGAEKMIKYINLFGFGRQTGIDLPYENAGSVHTVDSMDSLTIATNSFGQNYTVNMVQMAMAVSSAINGGTYYQPHIMKEIIADDGTVVERFEPVIMHKTVTEKTSDFIKSSLRRVVTEGTGTLAAIEGYEIGGKTGTAEKLPRAAKKYLVSFAGFTPVDDPEILVYVVVDNPSLQDGSELDVSASIAVALEKSFMEKILPYIAVPKDTSG